MPVMWQMNLHHIGNSTSFHVIVNKTSHVVPSLSVPVSRRKLPPMKRLPTWIKSHHDTSDSAQSCNFSSQAQSVHVKASFVQLQPATGCSVKTPNDSRKKHSILYVIELNSNALNSDVLVHLKREIQNYLIKNFAELNITLVLKCHVPVEWIVESNGIQGLLHIVAEHPVQVRTNPMILTTIIHEKILPLTTSALLSSIQNSFGMIDTYMKSSKANRVNIVIQEKQQPFLWTLSSHAAVFSPLSKLKFPGSGIGKERRREQICKTSSNVEQYVVEEGSSEDSPLLESSSNDGKISTGSEANFVLGKDKLNLGNTTTKKSDSKLTYITLSDANCRAKQNESHIILQTNWHGCGTRRVVNGAIQYYNQVQFITAKYGSDKDSFSEQKHLPTDDDDYISEDGSGSDDISSSHLKWGGDQRYIYPVPLHCTQPWSSENVNQPLPPKRFPLNVVAHNHLFAEASIKADFRLCIIVDECWLSEDVKPTLALGRKSVLIKQGCPTDLSVDILSKSHCGNLNPDVDHYKMRFSFQLSEEFINQQLYLHCRLASCAMRDSKQLSTKQCIISENFCLKQSLRPYLDSLQDKKFSLFVQGPIHVISKSRLEKGKGIVLISTPESSSTPENFAVDYSFDKLTGNSKKNPISQELVFVGLSTEAVVGIAFASFIIGAGLMATLWLIHMHTEFAQSSSLGGIQQVCDKFLHCKNAFKNFQVFTGLFDRKMEQVTLLHQLTKNKLYHSQKDGAFLQPHTVQQPFIFPFTQMIPSP
ncbi:hypothetical protein CEXT_12561 [Caerostris extrusa]|uniref:ZP domain-containing protein n=1 Tax=Caerostris extrusa TaxID=172846 RepID=A0AAV4PF17_CAEEX|nr:hypothetical protein CEXT_12561 [Caerostris extrusa]